MTEKKIYLDHNATTPLHPEVINVMTESMAIFGNPSSLHSFGRESRHLIEKSREMIASFIGAESDEIFFVGSGSEANNTVLSMLPCDPRPCCTDLNKNKNELITTTIEHPCVLEASKCLKKRGKKVTFLNVDSCGKIDMGQLKKALNDKTAMVSIMMANNEIGTIQDIKQMSDIIHTKKILFHTDAVQAVGKIPIDVKDLGVDFLTISAHKIYGPKGIGALYVKKGSIFCPLIVGGHQERGRRAGTENTLGIIGFAKAIELRKIEMEEEEKRLLELKNTLKEKIKNEISDIYFNGHKTDCLPGTLNVSFDGVEGESILLYLDLQGIAVSTGSACASGSLDPSHVLLATGIPIEKAHGSIRISLGRSTTKEEIERFTVELKNTIKKLRDISTVYTVKN